MSIFFLYLDSQLVWYLGVSPIGYVFCTVDPEVDTGACGDSLITDSIESIGSTKIVASSGLKYFYK